ncbi:hypothetical protein FRC07_002014 [Ceratobasidium sp. 392]|nr:hypothetical protein FRC07_002014 [Ceratobasidium sp. 392]
MNGYPSGYNSDPRMSHPDGSHRLPGMAPGMSEEQRLQRIAMNIDGQPPQALELPLAPTYPLYSQEPIQPNQATQHPRFPHAPTPPSPSFKALGKRRASSIDPPHLSSEYSHDTPEPVNDPAPPYAAPTPVSSAPDHTARQQKSKSKPKPTKAPVTRTRVMPSRLRRGTTAYGIGSNPIDAMIIEAQQRADPRAANGQRLRLKEWEIRREGNRFIPLTDEAASELAAAGLLDEQSAAEAAAAGILITAAGPGLPLLGGKGTEGYGSGFRPNLVPSEDEDEVEVEAETTVEGEVEAEHEEPITHEETNVHEVPAVHEEEEGHPEPPIAQPVAVDAHSLQTPVVDVPPRPSSGAFKIKLKVLRPSARSSSLSTDNTRPPSEQGSAGTLNDAQPAADIDHPADLPPTTLVNDAVSRTSRGSTTSPRRADDVPVYPSPAPSTVPLGGSLSTTNGVWTELPYHDVPYEHQSREMPPTRLTPAPPPGAVATSASAPALRLRTPRASTPAATAAPVLLVAAEREANQAAGRRGRNLRTAEAFGVKLPAFEDEKEFKLPEEWINDIKMAIDEVDQSV